MRGVRVLAAGVLCAGVFAGAQATSPPAYAGGSGGGDGDGGLGWHYDERGEGYVRTPHGGSKTDGEGGGPPQPDEDGYYWKTEVGGTKNQDDLYTWWCTEPKLPGQTGDTRDGECRGNEGEFISSLTCAGLWPPDTRPAMPHARLRQHKDWTDDGQYDPNGPWDYYSSECVPLTDNDWVSDEDIAWEVNTDVFQPLGKPKIKLEPHTRTVVNWETIVWTSYPDTNDDGEEDVPPPAEVISEDPLEIRIPIHIPRPGDPLDGYIRATADFVWEFEDGGTATGRGEPYVEGKFPDENPGYYLTNVFENKGEKTVTLTVTWTGEVYVEDLDPEQIEAETIRSRDEIEVIEGDPRLVR